MPSQTGYATTNATAVSGSGIVDQKRMHATRTYQWPGVPSRTESSPGRPLLGWPGAGKVAWVTGMKQAQMRRAETEPILLPGSEGVAPQGVELRHLRYFAAAADAGTFTHAADPRSR